LITNIQFDYLYRDAANYKKHGYVVFLNLHHLTVEQVEKKVKKAVIDYEYFIANEVNVPELHFDNYSEDDHDFHEIGSFSITTDEVTDPEKRSIETFIRNLSKSSIQYRNRHLLMRTKKHSSKAHVSLW
jgi:hypothetical protein